jgi:hypothetical protein
MQKLEVGLWNSSEKLRVTKAFMITKHDIVRRAGSSDKSTQLVIECYASFYVHVCDANHFTTF